MQAFPLIINFLIMPLFFLSGALFPIEGLPSVMEAIIKYNPLSYGVDGLRGSISGISHFGLVTDVLVLSILALVVFGIGTYLFSKSEA
jgi:ABC-2 type transport system permease protein